MGRVCIFGEAALAFSSLALPPDDSPLTWRTERGSPVYLGSISLENRVPVRAPGVGVSSDRAWRGGLSDRSFQMKTQSTEKQIRI